MKGFGIYHLCPLQRSTQVLAMSYGWPLGELWIQWVHREPALSQDSAYYLAPTYFYSNSGLRFYFRFLRISISSDPGSKSPQNVWIVPFPQHTITQINGHEPLWGRIGYFGSIPPWEPPYLAANELWVWKVAQIFLNKEFWFFFNWFNWFQSPDHPFVVSFDCINWEILLLAVHLHGD